MSNLVTPWKSVDKTKLAERLADLVDSGITKKLSIEILVKEFNCPEITRGKLDRIESSEAFINAMEERVNRYAKASKNTLKIAMSKITVQVIETITEMLKDKSAPALLAWLKIMGVDNIDDKKDSNQPIIIQTAISNHVIPKQEDVIDATPDDESSRD